MPYPSCKSAAAARGLALCFQVGRESVLFQLRPRIHQEKVQLILCPFATWLFLHYSAFFCFYLALLLFLSLILKKVEKGLQKVAKAEKAMPPYPFASFFSVLK